MLLKQDSGGTRAAYHRRLGISLDACRSLSSLINVFADALGIQLFQPFLNLIAIRSDPLNKSLSFFGTPAGVGLDLTESLKTEKADNKCDNGSNNTDRCKLNTDRCKPPIDVLCTGIEKFAAVVKKLAAEFVETPLVFNLGSGTLCRFCPVRRGGSGGWDGGAITGLSAPASTTCGTSPRLSALQGRA